MLSKVTGKLRYEGKVSRKGNLTTSRVAYPRVPLPLTLVLYKYTLLILAYTRS